MQSATLVMLRTILPALVLVPVLVLEVGCALDRRLLSPGESAALDRRSEYLKAHLKNGELYDATTLDRVWPSARKFPKPYWVQEKEDLETLRRR